MRRTSNYSNIPGPDRHWPRRALIGSLTGLCLAASAGVILVLVTQSGKPARQPPMPAVGNPAQGRIVLQSGVLATSEANNLLAQSRAIQSNQRYVVQLDGPLTPAKAAALRQAGVVLGDYLPDHAYIARLNTTREALRTIANVKWVGEVQPAWKLSPHIGTAQAVSDERRDIAARGLVQLLAWSFDGATPAELVQAVAPHGTLVGQPQVVGNHVAQVLNAPVRALPALAALPSVQWIEEVLEFAPRNDVVNWCVQSDVPNNDPLWEQGLHGENQIGGIIDTTTRQTHCAFVDSDPIGPLHRKFLAYYSNTTTPTELHGTHVCGTFVGDWAFAGGNPCLAGVAYAARVTYRNLNQVNSGTLLSNFTVAHADGARVHNNSFGANTTVYNASCVAIDQFTRDNEDDLIVFAVADSTSQPVKNPENSKNCLSVGSARRPPNQETRSHGGFGPTTDGRRRPEVFAPGENTVSAAWNSDCTVLATGGTSMACPAVSGAAILARQYFMDGFYPAGKPTPVAGFTPSGALLKAIMNNAATNMTGIADYPSNIEGWGRVRMDDVLYFAGNPPATSDDARRLWIQDRRHATGLITGGMDEYQVLNLDNAQRLKITMVFNDVPGALNSGMPVVNNLDLEVIAPNGNLYRGNVFDAVAGQSMTGGASDPFNNTEQVHLAAPLAGVYTIRVRGTSVVAPAGDPRQGYALVATGAVQSPVPAVYVALAGALPTFIAPGESPVVAVTILNGAQTAIPETALLHYRLDGGSFNQIPLTPIGGGVYQAALPAGNCGQTLEYYFGVDGGGGATQYLPTDAPAAVFSTLIRERRFALRDDFSANNGWSVMGTPGGAAFQYGVATGVMQCNRQSQPTGDHTGGACAGLFGTGLASGADANTNDVDGPSPTVLVSPVFNLAGCAAAEWSAWIWFYDGYVNDNAVTLEVSDTGGESWTPAVTLRTGKTAWQFVYARLDAVAAMTGNMRIRVVAADAGIDSTLEVLLDDVSVLGWGCGLAPLCMRGDMNNDGVVDGDDIGPFMEGLMAACPDSLPAQTRCAGDFSGNDRIAADDLPDFVQCVLAGGCSN